jgi:hypothetical protein
MLTIPLTLDSETVPAEEPRMPPILAYKGTNWNLWIESIEQHARWRGVWPYCNPSLADQVYPEIEEPRLPPTLQARPGAADWKDFGAEHFAELSMCLERYHQEYRCWATIQVGLREMSNLIRSHIDCYLQYMIQEYSPGEEPDASIHPRELLASLIDMRRSSCIQDLEPVWDKVLMLASNPALHEFFETWGIFIERCSEFVSDEIDWNDDVLRDVLRKTAGRRWCRMSLSEQPWFKECQFPHFSEQEEE